jgi:hypothetical protein
VDVGTVLGEAWALYRRFFGRFVLTAIVVFAVLDLLSALAGRAARDDVLSALLWSLVAAVIGLIGSFWVQAALVELVRDVRDGRPDRSVADTYRAVQPRLPAVVVAGVLAAVGIAIGFLLLIVPGVYLLTIWSMIIPAIVIEGRPAAQAFGRSREIVRGHGVTVFGLLVVTFLLVGLVSGAIQAVFAPLPGVLDSWLGALVAHSLTAPFSAAVLTTAYFHLTVGEPARTAADPAP